MADQITERRIDLAGRRDPVALKGLPRLETRPSPSREALDEALLCLDHASRQLKHAGPAEADEVLELLRIATSHLERAVAADSRTI